MTALLLAFLTAAAAVAVAASQHSDRQRVPVRIRAHDPRRRR